MPVAHLASGMFSRRVMAGSVSLLLGGTSVRLRRWRKRPRLPSALVVSCLASSLGKVSREPSLVFVRVEGYPVSAPLRRGFLVQGGPPLSLIRAAYKEKPCYWCPFAACRMCEWQGGA